MLQFLSKNGVKLHNIKKILLFIMTIQPVLLHSAEQALLEYCKTPGNIQQVKQLLKNNPSININCKNSDGFTPLMLATQRGYADIVRELVKHPNVDANIVYPPTQENALLLVIQSGMSQNTRNSIVQSLLTVKDIDVNASRKDHYSPLMLAAEYGYDKVVSMLVKIPNIQFRTTYIGVIGTSQVDHSYYNGWGDYCSDSYTVDNKGSIPLISPLQLVLNNTKLDESTINTIVQKLLTLKDVNLDDIDKAIKSIQKNPYKKVKETLINFINNFITVTKTEINILNNITHPTKNSKNKALEDKINSQLLSYESDNTLEISMLEQEITINKCVNLPTTHLEKQLQTRKIHHARNKLHRELKSQLQRLTNQLSTLTGKKQ